MKLHNIIMIGATGAVGSHVVKYLNVMDEVESCLCLGRRIPEDKSGDKIAYGIIDIFDKQTYEPHFGQYDTAICTLGVGEPSKVTRAEFEKVDKEAVITFADQCKAHGVKHFILLASVGIDSKSSNYYLRIKGELVNYLNTLDFDQLSIFKPSMILTPTNRYGLSQGVMLKVWPVIDKLFVGGLKKYRGIKVGKLGKSIAHSIRSSHNGLKNYTWNDFQLI